ncbi:hypothetical protein M9Y10_034407 [Tritrichomonas musculus]|uniref:Surface antigen BspA-like n=1 Tax=Tritrichomonas musculus TaxID=1915356 RepID=A0ABR2KF08_9EUKA
MIMNIRPFINSILNEMYEYVIVEGIRYQLNHTDFTASIINSRQTPGNVLIPRCIMHNSQDYIITSLKESPFMYNRHIKSLQFSPNSGVRSMEKYSLSSTSLASITFPASFEKLEKWAFNNYNIKEALIAPGNPNYKSISNAMIIGKSDPKSDIFDSLFFVNRNVQTFSVPFYISYIKRYCFSYCSKLETIEFPDNSQLLLIEKNAFSSSSVKKMNLPSSARLEEGWCNITNSLTSILIGPDNEYYKYYDDNKKIILGKNLENGEFDELVFGSRDLREVTIPNYVRRICSSAFSYCELLERVEIPDDSELISIGKSAFENTSISDISIPVHVRKIDDSAFISCYDLFKIVFDTNSELEFIGKYVFSDTAIFTIIIPKHVKKIGKFAFQLCENVFFCDDSEIEILDSYSFFSSQISEITIPRSVKVIGENCFNSCNSLKYIWFQQDSQLELIEKNAFSQTIIESITIPKHVKKIGKNAFFRCSELKVINFEEGSELQSIGKGIFHGNNIEKFEFPENLTDLQKGWCFGNNTLSTIIVSPGNKKFIMINKTILVAKNDENSESYDTLMFVNKLIEEVTIPSFIKYINPYAFEGTTVLLRIEFPEDSQLLSIGENAFNFSALETVKIPKNVNRLESGWCNSTDCLVNVSISPENKNFIFLPDQNKVMVGKSNSEQDNFDVIMFACRDIEKVIIPNYIKHIDSFAFFECYNLKSVEFSEDSQLQSVGDSCFSSTSIQRITFPKKIESSGALTFCSNHLLFSFEALADTFSFGKEVFNKTVHLKIVSLPNAQRVHNTSEMYKYNSKIDFSFFVFPNAVID